MDKVVKNWDNGFYNFCHQFYIIKEENGILINLQVLEVAENYIVGNMLYYSNNKYLTCEKRVFETQIDYEKNKNYNEMYFNIFIDDTQKTIYASEYFKK